MKRRIAVIVVLVAVGMAAWLWLRQCGGVSHREIRDAVGDESAAIRAKIDVRYEALDAKLDGVGELIEVRTAGQNAKLDRIEAKLDKILELATPKVSDGMRVSE